MTMPGCAVVAPVPGLASAADVKTDLHRPPRTADRDESHPGAFRRGVSIVVCTYRRPASMAALLESIGRQDIRPRELFVVDASPDAEAAPTQERLSQGPALADQSRYWQVTGRTRGLTRQRNFGLQHVTSDLVLFLDDDVVLQPQCVREMEEAHRSSEPPIAGVGCYSDDQFGPPPMLWRVRRAFGMVPSLESGRYWGSGMSVPWGFERPTGRLVEGDWLPGWAMMWRTEIVRAIGFDDGFQGYAQGEDLDFSLRARSCGRLVMLGTPRLRHCHEPAGRPDAYQLGYMELRNRFEIHRRALPARRRRDLAWFVYAWCLDTLLLARHLAQPGRFGRTVRHIAGRLTAATDLCFGRPTRGVVRNGR
jgi:GT2 family glycosyltransferase